ncbi:hypothetical protein ACKLNR_010011 [Fusarium oxysporum f. sp. zingiberi]
MVAEAFKLDHLHQFSSRSSRTSHHHICLESHTQSLILRYSSPNSIFVAASSIDSYSPAPSKKYKQATSFTSDTSSTSATSTASSIDLDYPSIQTPLSIDTLMPAFKNVQYDRPTYRSVSPQPPSPRSH